MANSPAVKFLSEYMKKAIPVIDELFKSEINKTSDVGEIPKILVQEFSKAITRGKGIRGALITLGYETAGGEDYAEILKTSIFYEIFHSGILVQDDFMDEDSIRRGLPSLHKRMEEYGRKISVSTNPKRYGYSMATCAGDYSFYLSWKILLNSNFPKENIIRASKLYAENSLRLVHGQVLDISSTAEKGLEEDYIKEVLWLKSGEYTTTTPLLIGATLGGLEDDERLDSIKKYAKCLGWCFQIQDDYLGMFGDSEKTGKPVGNDLREGKNSLFVHHLKTKGTEKQITELEKCFGNSNASEDEIKNAQQLFKDAGSFGYVMETLEKYADEGKNYVSEITKDEKLTEIYVSMLEFMVARTK